MTAVLLQSLHRRLGMAYALSAFPLFLVAVALPPNLGEAQRASIGLGAAGLGILVMQGLLAWAHKPLGQANERQSREFQKSLEQERTFVNAVSHEFRSPLTLVAGYSRRLLRRSNNLDANQRAALEVIDQEVGRLNRLLNDLMDLSRSDAGRLPMRKEPVHLELVFAQLGQLWGGDPIGSRLQFPDPSALQASWALGDPDRLKQVLINLVENAVKYTPAGSAIQLSLLPERDWLEIRVRDFGPGIPIAEQALIFERFRRGSTASGHGGSGLGLAVVRMLMHNMGGEVKLIPPGPEAQPGTTMGLRLLNAGPPPHPFPVVRSAN